MVKRQICKVVVLFVLILQFICPLFPAIANIHPLAGVADKSTTGIQEVDITMSIDWDPATVTGTEADPRGFTKKEFEQVIDSYARSVFAMTNGLHRLRNVYVFPNKGYWDTVDIRYISRKAGRSAADVSGWKKKQGDINMYVYEEYENGTWIRDDAPGPVLAHECGHYIYGIFDEYREQGPKGKTRAQLDDLSDPAVDDDGNQPSIMNKHAEYPNWFSVESAYNTATSKNTAQYRMFEKSIWGVLVGDPAADHENARDRKRTWFAAFKGVSVKSAENLKAQQTNALDGYKKTLNIEWMKATAYLILVLDNNVSATSWAQSLKSGGAAVRAATAGNWVSVLSGNFIAIDRTQLTAANKPTLIGQISSLGQGMSVTAETSLGAALAQVNKYRTETRTEATYAVYLVTSGNPVVPSSMSKSFTDAKAMLSVASITKGQTVAPGEEMITVTDLSGASGGRNNVASHAQTMESRVARDINLLEGDNKADMAAEIYPGPLASGGSRTMSFTIGPRDKAVDISMFVDEGEWGKVQPLLIDPAGRVLKDGSLAAGVSLEKDMDTGVWLFNIDSSLYNGALGKWSATMTAVEPTEEHFAITASAESDLALRIEVRESPLFGYVATASLMADRPILGARVAANIYNMGGGVMETLTLKDEGLNGDVRAGDGIYSARIKTAPDDEEYAIIAWADDNNGQAVESDRKMIFVSNAYINETPTGAFQRTDESAFTMSLGSFSAGGGSSGRCFLAEAAYGSCFDPHVGDLRSFRDRYLLSNRPGRLLVSFYYVHSPDWAAFIRRHDTARTAARIILTPVVYSIRYPFLPVAVVFVGIGYNKRKRWMPAVSGLFLRVRE
jgi:hypothetical protein